jgi:2-oxoglutarate ferredoxin oxidoreductase subunit gamma
MTTSGRVEVRLAGTGGQGLVLAGLILAEAAGLFDGRQVVQTQVYGPESRGGACRTDVIIDVQAIDYPKATAPHALLVMSADAWKRYGGSVRPGGTVLYDAALGRPVPTPGARLIGLPLTAVAREQLGRAIVANIVGLGALVALTDVVSREALERAVSRRAPRGSEALNRRAVAAGWELAAPHLAAPAMR